MYDSALIDKMSRLVQHTANKLYLDINLSDQERYDLLKNLGLNLFYGLINRFNEEEEIS